VNQQGTDDFQLLDGWRQARIGQGVPQYTGQQGQYQQARQTLADVQGQEFSGQQQQTSVNQGTFAGSNGVKSIAERIVGNPQLSTFAFLLGDPRYSEVVQLLSGSGPVTVFIPTNEAFSRANIDTTNVPMVRDLLKHHIVMNMAVTTAEFAPFQKLFSAQGSKLKVTHSGSGWMIDDANILVPDITAKNGVIFVIDRVLAPSPVRQTRAQTQTHVTSQGQSQQTGQSQQADIVKGQWHGAGLYCAQSQLYYCNEKTECVLQEACKEGCMHAEAGVPDYCFVPGQQAVQTRGILPNVRLPNLNQPPFQQIQQGAGQR